MQVHEALTRRSSVRAFRPDPIDDALLHGVLAVALESPSWANTQPYRLALASGARCERLRRELLDAAATAVPAGEYPLLFDYPAPLQARRRAAGFGRNAVLAIARDDHARREAQYRRNFAFFGAPAVAFLFAHDVLGTCSVLDAGVFLQSLLLAAAEAGLGTRAQASLASYPEVVRRHFDVPQSYKLLWRLARLPVRRPGEPLPARARDGGGAARRAARAVRPEQPEEKESPMCHPLSRGIRVAMVAALALAAAGPVAADHYPDVRAGVQRKDRAVLESLRRLTHTELWSIGIDAEQCDCIEPTCEDDFMLGCGGEVLPFNAGALTASRRTSRETCLVCACAGPVPIELWAVPVCVGF